VKRWALATLFLLGLTLALRAQSAYVIVDSARLPAESFVGDPVELRYTVRTTAVPSEPQSMPDVRWGEITSIRVSQSTGEFDLRVGVVPYEAGTLTLPRIDLGSLRLDGLTLLVSSVLPEGDVTLRPALGPERVPGTRSALLALAFGGSFLVAFLIYATGPGRKHLHVLLERRRARLPYRRLVLELERIRRNVKDYEVREFYIAVMEGLQVFMSSRIPRECRAATSSELIALLPALETGCDAPPGTASALADVIRNGDAAKFAHQSIRQNARLADLEVVLYVVSNLESYRRRVVQRSAERGNTEATRVGA
jgi:hypothetical protein